MPATYLALLRGINVGGRNPVPMAGLRACFEELGCQQVQTYIASGNVVFEATRRPAPLARTVEKLLPERFALDSELIKVLVLSHDQVRGVVDQAPDGFGARPDTYHCDAVFLMDISADDALGVFSPREGVDRIWQGELVIYSQRLSAQRTRSRLSKITESPLYRSMTIRSWATTTKLLQLMEARHDP